MVKFAVQVMARKSASVFNTREEALAYLRKKIEMDKAAEAVSDKIPA
ncbi:MAG: hypothetical protein R3E39_24965 [Anaerolineae bacterium]